MDGEMVLGAVVIVALLLGGMWAVSYVTREQCPEREPDTNDEDRAYMRWWLRENRPEEEGL